MSEATEAAKAAPEKRGQAAYKAELEAIAERNAQATKRGKERRAARELFERKQAGNGR